MALIRTIRLQHSNLALSNQVGESKRQHMLQWGAIQVVSKAAHVVSPRQSRSPKKLPMNLMKPWDVTTVRRTAKLALVCITSVVVSGAFAQSTNVPTKNDDDTIRVQQFGSAQVPDGVAFKIFLNLIAAYAEGDEPIAEDYIRTRMGLSADRAGAMVKALLDARVSLNREINESRRELFCTTPLNGRTNDELYRLFGTFDDLSDAISYKHMLLFKGSVSSADAGRLQQAIQLEKRNMGRIKLNHKQVYENHLG